MRENQSVERGILEKQKLAGTFEDQFNKKELFGFWGGEIEVVDVTPENLKTNVPIIVAPGWGEFPGTMKETIGGII